MNASSEGSRLWTTELTKRGRVPQTIKGSGHSSPATNATQPCAHLREVLHAVRVGQQVALPLLLPQHHKAGAGAGVLPLALPGLQGAGNKEQEDEWQLGEQGWCWRTAACAARAAGSRNGGQEAGSKGQQMVAGGSGKRVAGGGTVCWRTAACAARAAGRQRAGERTKFTSMCDVLNVLCTAACAARAAGKQKVGWGQGQEGGADGYTAAGSLARKQRWRAALPPHPAQRPEQMDCSHPPPPCLTSE